MTATAPLRIAANKLFKARDAELSTERERLICLAIRELEATGRRELSPIIERLSAASLNCCDNDCLVEIEERLRAMADPMTEEMAA